VGKGTACEFALAFDEACFACEGVGFVFKQLSEGVLDLCCQVGSAARRVWSVPSSGAKIDANDRPTPRAPLISPEMGYNSKGRV